MGGECSRDPHQAGAQAEDRSSGCAAVIAPDDGRPLSADLGAGRDESRLAATAVASAPHSAGAHPDHEPVASGSAERRPALQKETLAGTRTQTTGIVPVGPVGHPATARSVGVTGSTQSDDCGVRLELETFFHEDPNSPLADAARKTIAEIEEFEAQPQTLAIANAPTFRRKTLPVHFWAKRFSRI
jgi:hypothetical protein